MPALDQIKTLFWWLPFGHVSEISVTELNQRISKEIPLQIVDVRTGAEWRRSHISGAVSVPIQELKQRIDSLQLDPGLPIVAVCLSAHRSIPAVRLLQAKGYANAVQLQGGMLAWWLKHYSTEGEQ